MRYFLGYFILVIMKLDNIFRFLKTCLEFFNFCCLFTWDKRSNCISLAGLDWPHSLDDSPASPSWVPGITGMQCYASPNSSTFPLIVTLECDQMKMEVTHWVFIEIRWLSSGNILNKTSTWWCLTLLVFSNSCPLKSRTGDCFLLACWVLSTILTWYLPASHTWF